MTTWTEIFDDVDGAPVVGETFEYERTAGFYRDMATFAAGIHRDFEALTSGGVDGMTGQAANAFVGVVDDVASSLDDVPRVANEVADLLEAHIGRLDALRQQAEVGASSALARARVAWNERNEALDDHARNDGTVRSYDWQISRLSPRGVDPADDAERTRLEGHRATARWNRNDAWNRSVSAHAQLAAIRTEWQELRDEELRLDQQLADDIDDIKLGDLSDPGLFDKILNGAVGLFLALTPFDEIFDFLHGVVTAIATGDWGTLLHILSESLGTVLFVLGVVALFVAGPVLAVVLAITAVVALVKIAVDSYLYFSQTVDGRTGEPMSGVDYGFNLAGSVLALGGASAGLATFRGLGPSTRTIVTSDMLGTVSSSSRLGERGSAAYRYIGTVDDYVSAGEDAYRYVVDIGEDGFWSATAEHGAGLLFDRHKETLWPVDLFYNQLPGGYEELERDYSVVINGDGAGDVLTDWTPDDTASFFQSPTANVPFDLTPRPIIVDVEIDIPVPSGGDVLGPVLPDVDVGGSTIPFLNTPLFQCAAGN